VVRKPLPFYMEFKGTYIIDENGCWLWTGLTGEANPYSDRYGKLYIENRKQIEAHRYSYLCHKGEIPWGMCVCHTCDVPRCINPDHLFLGDHDENMKDKMLKGRTAKSPGRPIGIPGLPQKLTWEQVREIRKDLRIHRLIAEDYGVSRICIWKIKKNLIWKEQDKFSAETVLKGIL